PALNLGKDFLPVLAEKPYTCLLHGTVLGDVVNRKRIQMVALLNVVTFFVQRFGDPSIRRGRYSCQPGGRKDDAFGLDASSVVSEYKNGEQGCCYQSRYGCSGDKREIGWQVSTRCPVFFLRIQGC